MLPPLIVAAFLLAHGLVHALYLAPPPPEDDQGSAAWPFTLERSWILSPLGIGPGTTRILGVALVAVTIGGFALAAIAALGILPDTLWVPTIVIGAIGSLTLLGLFFRPWLAIGVAIDVVLLWAVSMAGWSPDGMTD